MNTIGDNIMLIVILLMVNWSISLAMLIDSADYPELEQDTRSFIVQHLDACSHHQYLKIRLDIGGKRDLSNVKKCSGLLRWMTNIKPSASQKATDFVRKWYWNLKCCNMSPRRMLNTLDREHKNLESSVHHHNTIPNKKKSEALPVITFSQSRSNANVYNFIEQKSSRLRGTEHKSVCVQQPIHYKSIVRDTNGCNELQPWLTSTPKTSRDKWVFRRYLLSGCCNTGVTSASKLYSSLPIPNMTSSSSLCKMNSSKWAELPEGYCKAIAFLSTRVGLGQRAIQYRRHYSRMCC